MPQSPMISVVVPARDAAKTIRRTLECLAGQDVDPGTFEVIVVDDASSDATALVARESAAAPLVIQNEVALGPGAARNAGVAAAQAPLLAFTDADCFPRPDWLRRGIEALRSADLVQGAVRPDESVERRPFDRSIWVGGEVGLYETANLLVRRELFEELGGFEDWLEARLGKPLAEDVWFGWRARRAGARTAFCGEAMVHHAVFRRGPFAYVRERARLTYFPDIVEKMSELRREFLWHRWFLNRRSAAFDLASVAALGALAMRSPLPLVATVPYALELYRSARPWGRRAPIVAVTGVAADAVGAAALLAGSVRRRAPVL